jgi:hypothetical protein
MATELFNATKANTGVYQCVSTGGDIATMRRYLDRDVLFTNEKGILSGWNDFRIGALSTPPKGGLSKTTVTDWVAHYSGDIAVTSLTNDQVSHYGNQVIDYKLISVETWIKLGVLH